MTLYLATIIRIRAAFSKNKMCAVRPIIESRFVSSILKLTSRRYSTEIGNEDSKFCTI